jgi:predicted enzyme involved in methoxymalonyl-ACP biosynthesis
MAAVERCNADSETIVRRDDISCFVANWFDKATNLRRIVRQWSVGLNSLAFVDDGPSDRSIVRRMLPEVAVSEVSGEPSDFIEALGRHRYFQVVTLAAEDVGDVVLDTGAAVVWFALRVSGRRYFSRWWSD